MSELELKQKSLPESSELYNSNSSFNLDDIEELKVGTGSHIFYTDKEGSRWGHIKFASAKAWIKVDGTFSFKNSAGDTVLDTDGITADAITDGLITAAMTSIAAINPVDGEINYNKVGTSQLDSLAVTEAKIAAGAVTAVKLTTYNFLLSAGTFTNNSPSAGYVAWANCKVVYNGTEHTITNGNSNKKHIYWQLASPTVFAGSDTLPALGNDDFLVSFNNSGTNMFVWNSTVINGNRITAGSITASNLAANTITANEIAASTITAAKMNVATLSAIAADLGTITAGTVTGATIQTATTGYRVKMSTSGLQFLSSDTVKGSIGTDASGSIVYYSADNHYFRDGSDELARFTGSGLQLPSNHSIKFTNGAEIIDEGSNLKVDRAIISSGQIRATGSFNCKISSTTYNGITDTFTYIEDIELNKDDGVIVSGRQKEREIKFKGGILYSNAAGSWSNIHEV